jgi:hypothetical protein
MVCLGNSKSPLAPFSNVSHPHRRHIPRTELRQRKGMNSVPAKDVGARSNTGSSGTQCPEYIASVLLARQRDANIHYFRQDNCCN